MTAWQYVGIIVSSAAILYGLVDGARVIRRGVRGDWPSAVRRAWATNESWNRSTVKSRG